MSQRLAGKVAIVTGGASGIGAAIARLFIEEGAAVMVADLSEPSDVLLLAAIAAAPDRSGYARTNVSQEEDIAATMNQTVDRWGKLDVAVACAGVPGSGPLAELTEKRWDDTMDVNAKGVFFVTKHAVPHMRRAGGGSIINISSVYALIGVPDYAAYSASKGAVRAFTRAAAIEYVKEGIRSNSIYPGVIATPLVERILAESENPQAARAMVAGQQPAGQMGTPEDIGWGCVYLASDESRFVSGAELVIDHCMTAR